jgi:hypothetical protein
MKKPKVGFALKKEAGEVIDSYQNYSNSVINNDEIWNSLLTEGGRQAIGAQMAVPIRTQLDYVGTARKFFEIDVLAQGQIARYDKDIDVKAYVVSKRGSVNEWLVEGEYVEPTTWEIFAPASIRLKEIQERRFNILDRTQEKIRIKIQEIEDEQYLALLATTVAGNLTVNPVTPSATGCDKNFMNDLSSVVMDHDLPCYGFLMRYDSFKDIRAWDNTDLDPVSMREILETGLYGTIWGIDIIVSRKVGKGVVYANTEPRFFGVMPIRTEVMLMPNDKPEEASIGYVGYENIGMTAVNANGVAVGSHN